MKKIGAKVLKILLVTISIISGVFLIVIIGGYITQRFVKTPAFKDENGDVVPNSIAEFRRIPINGDTHAILIRGRNLDNPVMLFLHAGPCLSETGLMRNFNAELENYYTMVYYDMRSTAKSYKLFSNLKKDYTTKNLLQDVHEITQYLKKSLGKDKIAVMGHSFGAGFGAISVCEHPEDYLAFVAIGLATNPTEQNKISYAWAIETAKKDDNQKAINELTSINNYWELTDAKSYFPKMMIHKTWIGHYGGQIVGKSGFMQTVLKNFTCKEYTIFDYPPFLMGMMAGGPVSFEMMTTTDLNIQAKDYKVPILFLTGKKDYGLAPETIYKYYENINAPLKKMYWFENSAHFPHIEETKLFQKIMIDEILPIIKGQM